MRDIEFLRIENEVSGLLYSDPRVARQQSMMRRRHLSVVDDRFRLVEESRSRQRPVQNPQVGLTRNPRMTDPETLCVAL